MEADFKSRWEEIVLFEDLHRLRVSARTYCQFDWSRVWWHCLLESQAFAKELELPRSCTLFSPGQIHFSQSIYWLKSTLLKGDFLKAVHWVTSEPKEFPSQETAAAKKKKKSATAAKDRMKSVTAAKKKMKSATAVKDRRKSVTIVEDRVKSTTARGTVDFRMNDLDLPLGLAMRIAVKVWSKQIFQTPVEDLRLLNCRA